jgi:DNA primase small subunit
VAIKVLNTTLREDFGFQHLLFVFSGRRGMHVWVSDEAARKLTDEQRSAVLGFINVFSGDGASAGAGFQEGQAAGGGAGGGGGGGGEPRRDAKHIVGFNRVMNGLTTPLHPSLQRSFLELEGVFVRLIIPKEGQGLLATPERWGKVLDMVPTLPPELDINLRGVIEGAWAKAPTPEKRWRQLVSTVDSLIKRAGGRLSEGGGGGKPEVALPRALRRTLEKLIPAIVFTFTYPRLDVEVSKHRNHLLKAPFCIHPKTGKICVPITVASVEDFDPNAVPTCGGLMGEGNAWLASKAAGAGGGGGAAGGGAPAEADRGDMWRHTSLNKYVLEFEEFLGGIQATTNRARRVAAEERSVMGGEGAW